MVSSFPLEQICYYSTEAIRQETEIGYIELYTILHQFQRLHFLGNLVIGENHTSFILHEKMYEFAQSGGFKKNNQS